MDILVTGGAGYVGSMLVPRLLNSGHNFIVVDTFWFGDQLEEHPRLSKKNGDVRFIKSEELPNIDVVIHLASIANDPSVDLDPTLSWEIGCLGTLNICNIARKKHVSTLILASSGSVYRIKSEKQVTEELTLLPISTYNKVKMIKERIALSFEASYRVVIYRPATICGWSSRMRLDLAVNALTFDAMDKGIIDVYGGSQMRPQLHIDDMVDAYLWAVETKELSGIFNIGFENDSILDIAKKVAQVIPAQIKILDTNDPRSYRLDSSKLLATGFHPKKTTLNAVQELKEKFQSGELISTDRNYNTKWMKEEVLSDSNKLGGE